MSDMTTNDKMEKTMDTMGDAREYARACTAHAQRRSRKHAVRKHEVALATARAAKATANALAIPCARHTMR